MCEPEAKQTTKTNKKALSWTLKVSKRMTDFESTKSQNVTRITQACIPMPIHMLTMLASKHTAIVFNIACLAQGGRYTTCAKRTSVTLMVKRLDGKRPDKKAVTVVESSTLLNTQKEVRLFLTQIQN